MANSSFLNPFAPKARSQPSFEWYQKAGSLTNGVAAW
jgi:hypothetical protein